MPKESVAASEMSEGADTKRLNSLSTVVSPTYRTSEGFFLGVRPDVPFEMVRFRKGPSTGQAAAHFAPTSTLKIRKSRQVRHRLRTKRLLLQDGG